MRLYGFNRWTLAPKLVMSLPGERDLRQVVLKEGPDELTRHWRSQRHQTRGGWLSWVRRDDPRPYPEIAYKLFVSPAPSLVGDALRELVPLLTSSRCIRFKIGATPSFLARPDKLVAYFDDRDEALEVADALRPRLVGLAAHGVPFTCPVEPHGLVSWGVDPPRVTDEIRSWRTWLCGELADAMVSSPEDRVGAAHDRLTALGIAPESWEPPADLWRDDGSD